MLVVELELAAKRWRGDENDSSDTQWRFRGFVIRFLYSAAAFSLSLARSFTHG